MANKRSKNYPQLKNFYLCIYRHIQTNNSLPSPKSLNISKQNLNYYVRGLKQADLIERVGYGVWKTLDDFTEKEVKEKVKKTKVVTTTKESLNIAKTKRILRYHSIQFKLTLPRFEYWNRRHIYLEKKNIPFKTLAGNKHRIVHKNIIFHLCSESIIFYVPETVNFYGYTSEDLKRRVFNWAKCQVLSLSTYLGIDLKRSGRWHLSLTRGEIEEHNNELAKNYQDQHLKLNIRDDDKELWLLVDKSMRTDNLELKSAKRHLEDTNKVIPFFNDIRNNKLTTISELKNEINELKGLFSSQMDFNRKVVTALSPPAPIPLDLPLLEGKDNYFS